MPKDEGCRFRRAACYCSVTRMGRKRPAWEVIMTSAEVQNIVRQEIERMFGGDESVVFGSRKTGQSTAGAFYQGFLEIMGNVQGSLRELSDRIGAVEHRLYDLDQVIRQQQRKA